MSTKQVNQDPTIDLEALDAEYSEKEQTGFPPYWVPSVEGEKIYAEVIGFDPGEETAFGRWHCKAVAPLTGHKGKREEDITVPVAAGEFFSMSEYAQLDLAQYVNKSIRITVGKKVALKGSKTMWNFEVHVSKATKAALAAGREAAAKGLPPGIRDAH